LLLRGISKGESTQILAQDLQLSRKQLHTLRQRIQTNLAETAPTDVMAGREFEADAQGENAGEKSTPHPDPADPPRRRAGYPLGEATGARHV
jgi:hypothetical protein